MSYLDNYASRINFVESSNDMADRARASVRSRFEQSGAYFLVQVETLDGTIEDRRVQSLSDKNDDNLLIHPDEIIESGYIVRGYKDSDWIVYKIDWTANVLKTAKLAKVNWELEWVDETTNTIISEPANVATISRRATGISEGTFMNLPIGQREILLRATDPSERIELGKRLAVNKRYFKVNDLDVFSFENCVALRLDEDLKRSGDDDNIADADDVKPIPTEIYIDGIEYITKNSDATYTLKHADVAITTGVVWALVDPDANFTLSITAHQATVTAPDTIGLSCVLNAEYDGNTYSITLTSKSLF